jgi:hypothetical protein
MRLMPFVRSELALPIKSLIGPRYRTDRLMPADISKLSAGMGKNSPHGG